MVQFTRLICVKDSIKESLIICFRQNALLYGSFESLEVQKLEVFTLLYYSLCRSGRILCWFD